MENPHNNMNEHKQSDTNKFFNELKGLADDFQSLRDEKKRLGQHIDMLLGENAILRERNRALLIRVDELKNAAETAAKVAMAYMADTDTSTSVVASFDRMYDIHDDENSIEKYIKGISK